jgi:uncharacterized protein YcfJ
MAASLACSAVMTGCAYMPTGPSVAVMPAPNKPFEIFVQEEQLCRNWAAQSIGTPGRDAASEKFVGATVAGAAIGAIAGAAIGGDRSAGAGAAMGTVIGASAGANQSGVSAWRAQRQYDVAYQQCMYAKGNLIPSYQSGAFHYPAVPNTMPPPPPN